MKRDYSELEGKEIVYRASGGDQIGVVLFCDPFIGITVVSKKDKDHYLICYKGPIAPQWRDKDKDPSKLPTYPENPEEDEIFVDLLKGIDEGVYDACPQMKDLTPFDLFFHKGPSAKDCPFAQ